ncbi:MAG: FAD binding domain-containing protein [Burkholderiaceae bacterium]
MELLESAGLLPTSARSLPPLVLHQPASVAEALACLQASETPVIVAGGTDLVACWNEGLPARELVDISAIAELRSVQQDQGLLQIGALVTHHAGSGDARVRAAVPGFARAWSRIANPRIRFRATLGGNLMARRTRYEGALLLRALQAQLEFATPAGPHWSSVDALWSQGLPLHALLRGVTLDATELLAFEYERSLRPLYTQAMSLWRDARGLRLDLVVATEYLRPLALSLPLPGVSAPQLAARARAIADDVLSALPDSFRDALVTPGYVRRAGAALLARQLGVLDVQ